LFGGKPIDRVVSIVDPGGTEEGITRVGVAFFEDGLPLAVGTEGEGFFEVEVAVADLFQMLNNTRILESG